MNALYIVDRDKKNTLKPGRETVLANHVMPGWTVLGTILVDLRGGANNRSFAAKDFVGTIDDYSRAPLDWSSADLVAALLGESDHREAYRIELLDADYPDHQIDRSRFGPRQSYKPRAEIEAGRAANADRVAALCKKHGIRDYWIHEANSGGRHATMVYLDVHDSGTAVAWVAEFGCDEDSGPYTFLTKLEDHNRMTKELWAANS